jgi:hypothetical protein
MQPPLKWRIYHVQFSQLAPYSIEEPEQGRSRRWVQPNPGEHPVREIIKHDSRRRTCCSEKVSWVPMMAVPPALTMRSITPSFLAKADFLAVAAVGRLCQVSLRPLHVIAGAALDHGIVVVMVNGLAQGRAPEPPGHKHQTGESHRPSQPAPAQAIDRKPRRVEDGDCLTLFEGHVLSAVVQDRPGRLGQPSRRGKKLSDLGR